MSELTCTAGYLSLNHYGETLCGDRVKMIRSGSGDVTAVLADGLGSGVKANILSTLTSEIIADMLLHGIDLHAVTDAVSKTLPGQGTDAYSTFCTFTSKDGSAYISYYDSPRPLFFRNGKLFEPEYTAEEISGRTVFTANTKLFSGDVFIMFSDGVENAGPGNSYNLDWKRSDIAEFMQKFMPLGLSEKTLCSMLTDKTMKLYEDCPADDATVCAVCVKPSVTVNMLIGPPADPSDAEAVMEKFFSRPGMHVICGGTTSQLAAAYLKTDAVTDTTVKDPDIPPAAVMKGADLVTEGLITLARTLEYAESYVSDNSLFREWEYKKDAASRLSRLLFETASDVYIFAGNAVNRDVAGSAVDHTVKMKIIRDLVKALGQMGKNVGIEYQ